MGFIQPTLPQVDTAAWARLPRLEKIRQLTAFWVDNGFGTQRVVHVAYALKCLLYAGGAIVLASVTTPQLGGVEDFVDWWSEPIFFQKAVIYTLMYEMLGLGCGSGPLTLRIWPPIGGILYWLRPGTVRLPPWPEKIPLTKGTTRTAIDVMLYAAALGCAGWILASPGVLRGESTTTPLTAANITVIDPSMLSALVVSLVLLGLRDKTVFLAARAEHYLLTAILFFLPVSQMFAAAGLVMLLLWWGAATSKITKHFPFVVSIMLSNSPLLSSTRFKRRLYRRFPDDLRPSGMSKLLAYGGISIEYVGPLVLVFGPNSTIAALALMVMVLFHVHILSTFPMGVPLEWNIFMIFSALFLFGARGDVAATDITAPWPVAIIAAAAAILVLGNLFPDRISFLPAMRYYAGNWATSYWCFREGAEEKLDHRLIKAAPSVRTQLISMYGESSADLIIDLGHAWRAMHHHGRALTGLLPRVAPDIDEYQVSDGEIVAGTVLGWNFGDGHLHNEQLLNAVQQRCEFVAGDLRVLILESQPLHRPWQRYRIVDAASGLLERGYVMVADMVERQPWLDPAGTIPVSRVWKPDHTGGPALAQPARPDRP